MFKCPYCPEERPSRSRLATHQYHAHRDRRLNVVNASEAVASIHAMCVCGLPIMRIDSQEPAMWEHIAFGRFDHDANPATDATDAGRVPDGPTVEERLDEAGRELSQMREQVEDINRRMAALDAPNPATIRREVLREVRDRIARDHHLSASFILAAMIRESVDGS